jgi:hypothetical protein
MNFEQFRSITHSPINDREAFDRLIQTIESEITATASLISRDSSVRVMYSMEIKEMSRELALQVTRGEINWVQAAREANMVRNDVLNVMRNRSTPVGRAYAEKMKPVGKTLNELVAKGAVTLFGKNADFNTLTASQRNQVYAEIVRSAGRSNEKVNAQMIRLSRISRTLLILSVGLSVYEIATAEDKVAVAKREAVVTGAGIAGGITGGALAGLACGPGAPVCVTVGAFIGGALAAFGAGSFW